MFDLIVIPLVFQVVIPVLLLVWVARHRNESRLLWLMKAVATTAYVGAIASAGMWLIVPRLLLDALVAALLVAVLMSYRATRGAPWLSGTTVRFWHLVVPMVAVVGAVGALFTCLKGRRMPDAPFVDVAFPLLSGRYAAVNAGSTQLVNAHIMTYSPLPRFRPYRGQSYGVDIVRLGRFGLRARGLLPSDPTRYAIFGEAVVAPCAGRIIAAVDGIADQVPPKVDRAHMAGNHVIIECGNAWIVIGHLQRGTVCVRRGDVIESGTVIGTAGNSGNSNEPHLHIHAQRPGTTSEPFAAEPLVLLFRGRYLVRNDVVEGRR